MIEIELFDGTVLEFPEGTNQAVIDRVAQQETSSRRIAAAKAGTLQMQPGSAESAAAADEAAMAQMVPPPSTAGDVAKSFGSGLLSGGAQLVGLPGTISDLLETGLVKGTNYLFGTDLKTGEELTGAPSPVSGQSIVNLIGAPAQYEPKTTPGEYAKTVGEFLPAAATGGVGGAIRGGVIPALASESAGQLTEGTAAEPYARAAAAVLSSLAAAKPGKFAGGTEQAKLANRLEEAGITGITAGQARGSQPLMRAEGMLQPATKQIDEFTAATMRQIGSDAKLATPDNLRAVEQSIVKQMDDAVAGVAVVPNTQNARQAVSVAIDYSQRVPAGQLTPRIRGIANEILKSSSSGNPVALSQLKTWRSDIGKLTVSPDAATREAAHSLRGLIDNMTDDALIAAGREGDIASLAAGREAYRNYIGVRDAASRAGAEAGTLSPQALNQSMIRAQGREAYATGRSTPMTEFTRAGAAILRPAPTVAPGGVRTIAESLPLALASLGAGGSYAAGLGPVGLALGGAAGALAPTVGQAAMRSSAVQAALRDPSSVVANIGRVIPGLLAQ